jgi:hypothetical protein
MGNVADYFEKIGYKPTWIIGDRVQGIWNKIPFRGTVGNDSLINELDGPRVSVHLDLPIKYQEKIHSVIFVKPKQLKELK